MSLVLRLRVEECTVARAEGVDGALYLHRKLLGLRCKLPKPRLPNLELERQAIELFGEAGDLGFGIDADDSWERALASSLSSAPMRLA